MSWSSEQAIPTHVAIIMDGNGRWAKSQGKSKAEGHAAGVQSLREAVEEAKDCGVKYLTAYAFSTENWGRPQEEVQAIMELFSAVVIKQAEELAKNNIALRFIGDSNGLNPLLQEQIKAVEAMEVDTAMTLTVAMNYSARWDILNAAKRIAAQGGAEKIEVEDYKNYLSTAALPDVDLVIRTSGEQRLSNFMLWESSYAELYFTEKLWPEFKRTDFKEAILWFEKRNRRYGVREENE